MTYVRGSHILWLRYAVKTLVPWGPILSENIFHPRGGVICPQLLKSTSYDGPRGPLAHYDGPLPGGLSRANTCGRHHLARGARMECPARVERPAEVFRAKRVTYSVVGICRIYLYHGVLRAPIYEQYRGAHISCAK